MLDTMQIALEAVRTTLDETKREQAPEAFAELLDAGVSHELLKSLSIMTADAESAVQVVRYDKESPRKGPEIAFSPRESAVLSEGAKRLATGTDEPQETVILGEVTLLDHASEDAIHVVRVNLGNRKVRVRLTAQQYRVAFEAHGGGALLRAHGTVEKDNRSFWMYDPSEVSLVTPEEAEHSLALQLDLDDRNSF